LLVFFEDELTTFRNKHKTDVTLIAWHGIPLSHKINKIFWSKKTFMWIIKIFKIIKNKCFYPPRILEAHCLLVYKHRPERTGFNYEWRVFATAIRFSCLITLTVCKFLETYFCHYLRAWLILVSWFLDKISYFHEYFTQIYRV